VSLRVAIGNGSMNASMPDATSVAIPATTAGGSFVFPTAKNIMRRNKRLDTTERLYTRQTVSPASAVGALGASIIAREAGIPVPVEAITKPALRTGRPFLSPHARDPLTPLGCGIS
jgi:hypothetical protein